MIKRDKELDIQISDTFRTARNRYLLERAKNTRRIQKLESDALSKNKQGGEASLFDFVEANRNHPGLAVWDDCQKDISRALVERGADYYKINGLHIRKNLVLAPDPDPEPQINGPHIRKKGGHPTIYLAPGDHVRGKDGCFQMVVNPGVADFIDMERVVYTPEAPVQKQKTAVKEIVKKLKTPPTTGQEIIISPTTGQKMIKCPSCKEYYPATRSTRKYCNKSACRQAASRAARAAKEENS